MPINKIEQSILRAQKIMAGSKDPAHDLEHSKRVVQNIQKLCQTMEIHPKDEEALILAAWWHDVSRAVIIPSAIIMPMIDDFLSAIILFFNNLSLGLIGGSSGKAFRLILCKSPVIGRIFSKFFIHPKTHLLLNLLKDSDALDIINTSRIDNMILFLDKKYFYRFGYKVTIWWNLKSSSLIMKTIAAQEEIEKFLQELSLWAQTPEVMEWHNKNFGEVWTQKTLVSIKKLLAYTELKNLKNKI